MITGDEYPALQWAARRASINSTRPAVFEAAVATSSAKLATRVSALCKGLGAVRAGDEDAPELALGDHGGRRSRADPAWADEVRSGAPRCSGAEGL
jgi:hypothetical protein